MTVGVLLATYGSPSGPGDVARYLEDIIGREPTDRQVEGLRDQYDEAGGYDLLPGATERQAAALETALVDRFDVRVEIGYEHSPPFIADVVETLAADVDRGVALPLAPHYNTKSVAGYHASARQGLARLDDPPPFAFVDDYHDHPDLVAAWTDRVGDGLDRIDADDPTVTFVAHSLPRSILDEDDPYPEQVLATCRLVADAADVPAWRRAWQSAPPHGDWLSPDILDDLEEAVDAGHDGVVCAPVGFVSDHMETRYDLDVEAAGKAKELGLAFERVPGLDDDPRFIDCLADVVGRALG